MWLPDLVCKIPLLARALGLKAKRARDDRVSCIQYRTGNYQIGVVHILRNHFCGIFTPSVIKTHPLGAVYKRRPPNFQTSPCPGVSEFPKPPPPRTSASGFFQFYTFLLIKTKFIAQFLFYKV